eukprot:TRINITY_DN18463_c0_g1_i2.p1 TRINITY_DN18463_c0_g1~~TRINITY_DN18463_c0_g1_i2.p1  ORF type:complete len:111 (+),score=12.01 TRINITY_DN18463_c0_g1_i2:117-449(+)
MPTITNPSATLLRKALVCVGDPGELSRKVSSQDSGDLSEMLAYMSNIDFGSLNDIDMPSLKVGIIQPGDMFYVPPHQIVTVKSVEASFFYLRTAYPLSQHCSQCRWQCDC